ncbi:acyl-CoA dehydrogenase [Mycobacterium sp. 050134]|uniref:acyl-CoA dehydrogenase n=1 Tax=Mycobacterium sp. 050134 TaxID=3096111 RepID=UPI002ED7F99F
MYQPPIDDYEFLLRHVIDGPRILENTTAGEFKIDDASDILSGAAALAVETWHPLNSVGDRLGNKLIDGVVVTPPGTIEAYRTLADAGWVGVTAPKSAGGEGLPWIVANALNEIWSAASVAMSLSIGLSMAAIGAIDASADEHLRATYLPAMIAGRWTGTMNLTEPQAGTDLAGIRTMARPNDDGTWAVKGQKIFITWGDHDLTENIVHLVLARTPDAPEGLGGFSLFLVPKFLVNADGSLGRRNHVHTLALEHKLGIHASPTCVLDYDDATGFLIGGRHAGLFAMFVMMNISRVGTGVQGLGVSDRAYQQARDYAAERIQGRVVDRPESAPIAEHPDVTRLLTSMASIISAMRGLSVQVAEWLDLAPTDSQAAQLAELFVPVLKGWCAETSLQVTSDAVQVHGGAGFIEETGVAQYYRDARILTIYEGTTAIQAKDLVGRKVLRDGGATAAAALAAINATVEVLHQTDHPVAARTAHRLERAIASVQHSTRTMLQFGEAHRKRDAYAGSVAYLLSWGLLGGAWMHARMLAAALSDSDQHTERRVAEADFYGAHHLSRIGWLAETIEAGETA